MPQYYFHISFELYPQPDKQIASHSFASSSQSVFTPPRNTDIFTSKLPIHPVSSWGSSRPLHHSHKRSKTSSSSIDLPLLSTQKRPSAPRRLSHLSRISPGDDRQSPVPLLRKDPKSSGSPYSVQKDWRFGRVCIQSIDMSPVAGADGGPRGKSISQKHVTASSGGLETKGKFIPSDPNNTEVGWGVVHLYRDGQETPGLYDDAVQNGGPAEDEDCTTLCILAVPSYMTPSDLLGFVGEQTREDVSHFRLIRTDRANRYMVLMKFRDAKKAKAWKREWNGKLFNSMEPENCHVVFIKSITFQTPEGNRDPSNFPNNTNDPFTPAASSQPTAPLPATVSSPVETAPIGSSLTHKPIPPPTPSLIELPTCPVCLERMDETTGLLTILCQHVFHCACLEKWKGSGCPVCRYTQNDTLLGTHNPDGSEPENECSVCGSTSNLWICLICGNVGCGRYDSAHAFAHWEATSHTYAMDVSTQHVWDYAGDGYVHRLIQNKADGKLVDLPASTERGRQENGLTMTGYAADTVPREKLDNMGMEYTFLLTNQLESQRAYFEEQVERAADKAAKAAKSAEDAAATASELSQQLGALKVQHEEAQSTIKALEKDSARQTARATSASELARKLTKQFKEEQTMNESLMTRINFLESRVKDAEKKVEGLDAEKRELEEQNRDLSFFISGQEKLKEMQGNEVLGLQEGEVEGAFTEVVGPSEERKGRRKGKGRK